MCKKKWSFSVAIIIAGTVMVSNLYSDNVFASSGDLSQRTIEEISKNEEIGSDTISENVTEMEQLDTGKTDITDSFTDENFKIAVRTRLGINKNEPITEEDCILIKTLDVSGKNIQSLDGIEYFTELEYLDCSENQLDFLDVSQNPTLKTLICNNNELDFLDVEQNTVLNTVNCDGNEITSLDVSQNIFLQELSCGGNELENLNVSKNPALIKLDCSLNLLKELDVDQNPALESLSCDNNQLGSLDVDQNKKLVELGCGYNQIVFLDVSCNTALTALGCYGNLLENLDVSKNTLLKWLACDGNQLNSLDLSRNKELVTLSCGSNWLENLDVSKNVALRDLFCEGTDGCPLESLDISKNVALETLHCYDNCLKTLDISKNTALKMLNCNNNQLGSLDVSHNIFLETLLCSNNRLKSLDVSHNTVLNQLECSHNYMGNTADVVGKSSTIEDFVFNPQNRLKQQKLKVTPSTLILYIGERSKKLKVSGAKGRITYKSSDTSIAKLDDNGTVIPVTKGNVTITVQATGSGLYGAATRKIKVVVYGKLATIKKVKITPARSKCTVKVSWDKMAPASGYIIRYSYKKNMVGSKNIKITGRNTCSRTLKKLKSKKYLYIQVQAYIKDGGRLIKGPWSKVIRSKGKIK